jgi:hypothetical protein
MVSFLSSETSPPSPDKLIARATGEPATSANTWSKGYGAAGFSLLQNLTYILKDDVSGYAVQYPAAMGSQGQGTTDILKHVEAQVKACPNMKFSMGGHSQGGFAVVDAVPKLSPEALKRLVSITMFGSPACPASVRDRCISYCNSGDSVSSVCWDL